MYIVHGAVGLTSNLLDVSEIRFRRASTTGYAGRDGLDDSLTNVSIPGGNNRRDC